MITQPKIELPTQILNADTKLQKSQGQIEILMPKTLAKVDGISPQLEPTFKLNIVFPRQCCKESHKQKTKMSLYNARKLHTHN